MTDEQIEEIRRSEQRRLARILRRVASGQPRKLEGNALRRAANIILRPGKAQKVAGEADRALDRLASAMDRLAEDGPSDCVVFFYEGESFGWLRAEELRAIARLAPCYDGEG